MSAIEQKAREFLADQMYGYAKHVFTKVGDDEIAVTCGQALRAIIAALTPPEGDMGNPISVPDGFVLVPVEPTEEMLLAAKLSQGDHDDIENWLEWEGVAAANQYRAMLAARPEVKP